MLDRFLDRVEAEPIEKERPREPAWRALHRIADKAEPRFRRAFLRAVRETQDAVTVAAVRRALERGDITAALDAVPVREIMDRSLAPQFEREFRDAFEQAGAISAKQIAGVAPFIPTIAEPRVTQFMAEHSATLVREITETTRAGLRTSLTQMMDQGWSVGRTANVLREQIGLTERGMRAVLNFRERLETDRLLSAERISQSVQRYHARLLRQRATMIARTESAYAVSAGQEETWRQAAERDLFDPNQATREWVAVIDDATDEDCIALDGVEVGLYEPFPGGVGTPPIHPNCRCVLVLKPRGRLEQQAA